MFQDNRITVYSGYATLFIVTALIPFIILIIALVSLIPGYSAEDVTEVLLQLLPDLSIVEELIVSLISDIKEQSSGLLASAAAVTALWAASKGVMAIQKGLNQLDSGEETDKATKEGIRKAAVTGMAYVKNVLKRLLFTLTLILLFPALIVCEVLGESAAGLIGSVVIVLLVLLVVLEFYAKLPKISRTLKSQLPGAALTVICWLVFTELFAFFISTSYKYSNVYGALAAVFLLLMWLRYMIMILFGGAILNRVLEKQKA